VRPGRDVIIRDAGATLRLITQPDHAALSRRVMASWTSNDFANAPRRRAILVAIGEHDNGWQEPDASPIVEPISGRLLDFVSAPLATRHSVWPRAVARLAAEPWAAALVAEHALHIYARFRPLVTWAAFFADMEALRAGLLASSGLTAAALEADYAFLRLGDLVSLVFCNGWTEAERHDGVTVTLEGATVRVSPDPFGGARVPLSVAARDLPNRPFADAADAEAAFRAARVVTLAGTATGAPARP